MFRSRGMIRLGAVLSIVVGFVAVGMLWTVVQPPGNALAGKPDKPPKPPKPSPPGDDVNIIQQDTAVAVTFDGDMGLWDDDGDGIVEVGEIVPAVLVDGEDYLTCFAGRSRGINVSYGRNTQLFMAIDLGPLQTGPAAPPPGPNDVLDPPLWDTVPDAFAKPDVIDDPPTPNILVMSEDVSVTIGPSENVSGLAVEIYPENLYTEEGLTTGKRPRYGREERLDEPFEKWRQLPDSDEGNNTGDPFTALDYKYMFSNAKIQFTGPNGEEWAIYFGKGPIDAILYDNPGDRVFTWRGAYYHYTHPDWADWVMIERTNPDSGWPEEGSAQWAVNSSPGSLGYLWHKGDKAQAPKNNDPWYYVGAYKVGWSADAMTLP